MTRSQILALPGAIADQTDGPDDATGSLDAAVPWHFGDPFAEQRAAARTVAVVDRSHRAVIAVTGKDRLSWLHLVLSQHLTELPEGGGTEALVLDSQGRVNAHLVLGYADGTVWLDTEAGASTAAAIGKGRQSLLDYLVAMRFWSEVDITDATADRALLSVVGPRTAELLASVGLPAPDGAYATVVADGVVVRRMPWPGKDSADLLVPRAELVDWWRRLTDAGARPMGSWGYDAMRVESVRPRAGLDTDEKTIPHEVNWVPSAAHVAKGCYRGQETVSKVHNIGRPPRRLVLLHLDGSPEVLPSTGDPIRDGERVVGRVGTVARHHELGPIALALVKRSVSADTELIAGDGDERVQAAIDEDTVLPDTIGPGRAAARGLRG
jgi:folate-binding protein YgfZ